MNHESYIIQHPYNGRIVYSDLHHPPWTTSYHDVCIVLKLFRKAVWYRSISWVWLEVISWLVEYKTVARHSPYMYDLPWTTSRPGVDAVFKIDQKTRITYDHVWGVVANEAMSHDSCCFYTYQIWDILHTTLLKQCASISRPVWSSFDQLHDLMDMLFWILIKNPG